MDHQFVARCLLTFLAVAQGAATLSIDLNRTHATHPLWPGHARFHLVWQAINTALLSLLALWFTWQTSWPGDRSFYLAAALTLLPCGSFLIALLTRDLYAGTLWDPQGIPPAHIKVFGRELHVDGNTAAVWAAVIAGTGTVFIYIG